MTEVPVGPPTCISRNEKRYKIEMDLPEQNKEDIDLQVTRTEIYVTFPKYGSEYTPSINLDYPINPEKVEARFKDGVLEITAPLVKTLKKRKIKIK